MAKEASSANPSIPLHEVLKAEFAVLHGKLPPDPPNSTDPNTRLRAIWAAVHELPEKRAALCISGGGIRSATFGLGVLQGLARCGLLDKFHYLSTVSGGGYIGSWLSAWINRAGLTSVTTQLAHQSEHTRPNPEPLEIQNLRSYSNYLSPRLGFFSADSWTLVGTYLRNLMLNWFVIIPLLAAFLALPWIFSSIVMMDPPLRTDALFWSGAALVVIGVAYMGLNLPSGGDRRWNQKRFLLFCLLPLFLASVLMTIHWAWFNYYGRSLIALPFFGFGQPQTWVPFLYLGIALHIVSWLTSLLPAHGFRPLEFLAVIVSGALGGVVLWLGAQKLFPHPVMQMELYICIAVPGFMALFFLAIMAFAGMSSRWTEDPDREWWGRAAGWLLAIALSWLIASGLVVFGPLSLKWTWSFITAGGLAGLLTVLGGRSPMVAASEKERATASPLGLILSKASTIAALIFAAILLILITQATTSVMKKLIQAYHIKLSYQAMLNSKSGLLGRPEEYLNVIFYTPWWLVVPFGALLLLASVVMARLINANKFSLHGMYRERLIRAYLGASNSNRNENPFTGFDENDNIKMRDLWVQEKFGRKLMPVINIALNLVSGEKLGWQERKAQSFTVSPLHCGSSAMHPGYRSTTGADGTVYGGPQGISLGSAITISGAAASPNMGYHSSPFVTFILTLLNVRLGAWLGNPGEAGDHTFHLGYPESSVQPIIDEALGLTNDRSPYVYLSDGGHFENLGLYEMVLRRCHFIVISDAGQDPECSFADLGESVRKIRIDFGIPIEFESMTIHPRSAIDALKSKCQKGHNCAIGRIRYSAVDPDVNGKKAPDGIIIYIKPACYGEEPRDIYEYFKRSETFPHESTADQFFAESQFESYRMLGAHTMEKLCTDCDGQFRRFDGDFRSLISVIFGSHLQIEVPKWLKELIQPSPSASDAAGAVGEPNKNCTVATALPRFGLRSLLDLLQTWISIAYPISRLIDLRWINWNRARNFFASRH
ncbi:MAG TPA: patatin-like phospholipase family protein [Candidatus Udaeobacter sp.]